MAEKVIFVCLGNICRSPMAEAIFQKMVDEAGLSGAIEVDSVGTGGWHAGEPAHRGTRRVLARHGIDYTGRARQITAEDVAEATYVVAMDSDNLATLRRSFGDAAHYYRLLDFVPEANGRAMPHDVPDPYYTGNFEYVYELVSAGCRGLFEHVRRNRRSAP